MKLYINFSVALKKSYDNILLETIEKIFCQCAARRGQ